VFGKKKQQLTTSSVKRTHFAPSIISQDMRITGSLSSQGEVQLDGQIEGDIKATHLIIGSTGVVEGIVEAKSVIVKGKILGSLIASEVNIKSNAHVHGDIFHDTLSIEAGAIIEGNLKQCFEKEELELINEEIKSIGEPKGVLDEDDNELAFINKQAAKIS
jgi:cytoskeletal protein CcmA (bactofilin family)